MNIKKVIVTINDTMVYTMFAIVFLFAILIAIGGSVWHGVLVAAVGTVICSVLSGFWIVASASLQTQQKILEKLNKGE